jgi:FkbM family methyltransferase
MRSLAKVINHLYSHPLNRGGRLQAINRFFRWQVASRLMPWPIAFPFVDDMMLFAKRGMHGATGNWYCGLDEYRDMAFVLHFLRAEDCFVDVGANVGSYSVLAGGAAGAEVVAIEPIPTTFRHLRANLALNGLVDRVMCHNVGISDSNGVLRFTSDLGTVNHVVFGDEDRRSISVPVFKLDELVGCKKVPRLIKLDVEGHESAVLRGGEETLACAGVAAVIMETNGSGSRYGVDDEVLFQFMKRLDFTPFSYEPTTRRLAVERVSVGNTIFVRDRDFVESRVSSSKTYRLINGRI